MPSIFNHTVLYLFSNKFLIKIFVKVVNTVLNLAGQKRLYPPEWWKTTRPRPHGPCGGSCNMLITSLCVRARRYDQSLIIINIYVAIVANDIVHPKVLRMLKFNNSLL